MSWGTIAIWPQELIRGLHGGRDHHLPRNAHQQSGGEATTFDPSLDNNTATAVTAPGASANLSVTKTAGGPITAGSPVTYTITVTNSGPSDATGVVVRDTLPAGMTFSTASGSPTVNGQAVTWPTIAVSRERREPGVHPDGECRIGSLGEPDECRQGERDDLRSCAGQQPGHSDFRGWHQRGRVGDQGCGRPSGGGKPGDLHDYGDEQRSQRRDRRPSHRQPSQLA